MTRNQIAFAALLGVDIDRGLVEDGRHDLRRHKALPDQLVDLELVFLQILLDLVGMAHDRGGTNGFVRFLRVLLLLVGVRLLGQILRRRIRCRCTRALRPALRWKRGSNRYAYK